MFFNYRKMETLGYKVCGISFKTLNTCQTYVKYFPNSNSVVVFSTMVMNKTTVYKMSSENYKKFADGKVVLPEREIDKNTKSIVGYDIIDCDVEVVFEGGEIKNTKELVKYLNIAEEKAKQKE